MQAILAHDHVHVGPTIGTSTTDFDTSLDGAGLRHASFAARTTKYYVPSASAGVEYVSPATTPLELE